MGDDLCQIFASRPLANQELQAVFGVEAVELPGRPVAGVVPDPNVEAVGVEDHRPLPVLLLQAIGVALGLGAPHFRIGGCFLGLDDRQRFAVTVVQNIIRTADAALGWLILDFDLLADFVGGLARGCDFPARIRQLCVNQSATRFFLVEVEDTRHMLGRLQPGAKLLFRCFGLGGLAAGDREVIQ